VALRFAHVLVSWLLLNQLAVESLKDEQPKSAVMPDHRSYRGMAIILITMKSNDVYWFKCNKVLCYYVNQVQIWLRSNSKNLGVFL